MEVSIYDHWNVADDIAIQNKNSSLLTCLNLLSTLSGWLGNCKSLVYKRSRESTDQWILKVFIRFCVLSEGFAIMVVDTSNILHLRFTSEEVIGLPLDSSLG